MESCAAVDELLTASTGIMSEDREYMVRTLQHDIKTIEEVLRIRFRAILQEAIERNK